MSWSGSDNGWSSPPPRFDEQAQVEAFKAGHEVQFVEPNKPPLLWLGVSLLFSVSGMIVALVTKGATMGVVAWILAGPLAIAAIALFTTADAKQRESGWYAPSGLAEWGRRLAVLLALAAVAFAAWPIANDVARGVWT